MIDQTMGGGRGEVDEESCQDNRSLETASSFPLQDGEVILMAFVIPLFSGEVLKVKIHSASILMQAVGVQCVRVIFCYVSTDCGCK